MKFQLILTDKPQSYANRHLVRQDGVKTRFGIGAAGHYDVADDATICSWPIKELADPAGCILASWGTCPNIPFDVRVIEAWGFSYATLGFSWLKTNKNDGNPFFGVGGYTGSCLEDLALSVSREELLSQEMERLFFARYGSRNPEREHKDLYQIQYFPHVRYAPDHPKVLSGEKREGERIHSSKPHQFALLLDRLYGTTINSIELFARPGNPSDDVQLEHWFRSGLEFDGLDIITAIKFYSQLPDTILPSVARVMAMAQAMKGNA